MHDSDVWKTRCTDVAMTSSSRSAEAKQIGLAWWSVGIASVTAEDVLGTWTGRPEQIRTMNSLTQVLVFDEVALEEDHPHVA